jgi:Methyltransferase FkbM domain
LRVDAARCQQVLIGRFVASLHRVPEIPDNQWLYDRARDPFGKGQKSFVKLMRDGAVRRVKSGLFPEEARVVRLPFGVGRGLRIAVGLRGPIYFPLGIYEYEVSGFVRHFCRPGFRSFDVGSDGYYALVFSKLTGADVLAVDGADDAVAQIKSNIAANPEHGRRIAIRQTRITNGADGMSLDQLADEFFVPDFIKLDIDGYEVEALQGAAGILSRRRPHLIVETHAAQFEQSCLEILGEHGYSEPHRVQRRRWLREDRPLRHNRWLVARGRDEPLPAQYDERVRRAT